MTNHRTEILNCYNKVNNYLAKKGGLALRNLRSLGLKFGMALASLALMVTSLNVNTTCMLIAHQPKLPENAKKLRKF